MFFSASIALTFVLSLSGIAVRSAPVKIAARADFVPKACSGPNGTGTCVELGVTIGDGRGTCTNVDSSVSLVLNVDNDCVSTQNADCTLDFTNPSDVAVEHFSDDADINNLPPGIKSISCQAIPGLVNGLFPQ
ncbi:hypothetical protein C8F04DRAFT_1401500 [Mycena alexandri]|uniref:Uncharacterized protein n=1 Tax=Mycena alexandri TaxID=1745969 RepID=A0AAD6SBQ1_9AGAR|nr:hypothetical protein C8F04DRAFT_1401500 [Mycena alexandri]